MSVEGHDLHLLTGAYAVDAVTGAELARFEKHLERCAACAEEVRGLRETAARLGMATAIAPPPGMRERVLAATSRTRQLPPSGPKPAAVGAPGRMRRLRRALPRPSAIAAMSATAAMAAAVIVLAVLQVDTRHQLQQEQAGNRAVAAVLAAPDARMETSATTVGGTVTAVISPHDREAVITTAGMPAASAGKAYQLWVITASGARSAGLLSGGVGATAPVLAGGVAPGDRLGITIEPAGGSSRPTSTPIVLLAARG